MTLIDTEMAAAMLRCTPRHVRRIIERGDLPNRGRRSYILIDLEELSRLISEGKVKVAPRKK